MCVCMCARLRVCEHVHLLACVCVCMRASVCVTLCARVIACVCLCACVCMCTCVRVCMRMCVFAGASDGAARETSRQARPYRVRNTLQRTATNCNALQHTACKTLREARTEGECRIVLQFVAVCDIDMLQCGAVCMRTITESTCTC